MKALLVVAQAGFQAQEYADTRKELEAAGVEVMVASFAKSQAVDKKGNSIEVDLAISSADVDNYDAVVLIGGSGAKKEFLGNEEVINLVKAADNAHKIVGAICIAPRVLAEAHLLKDRRATVHNGDGESAEIIASLGATYSEEAVVVDTRIVTANGPGAALEFGKTIALMIKKGVGPSKEM